MKTTHLLAAVALAFMPASAHAYLLCSNPVQTIGATGSNPVVQTYVGLSDDRSWTVVHKLADGTMIDRAKQYSMSDATDRTKIGWRGRLNAVQHIWMEGRIMVRDATGGKVYVENLYDEDKGNLLVMHSETDCVVHDADTNAALPDGPTSPPVTAQEPAQGTRPTAVAGSTAVLLFSEANGQRNFADTMIGSLPIRMLLDTGATEMSVTDTVAHTLMDKREASWGRTSRPSWRTTLRGTPAPS